MANFPGLILTEGGRYVQAKAQLGRPLEFTRVGLGAGSEPDNPEALTTLVDEQQTLSIQSFDVIGDGTSKIRAILTNQGVTTGFFVREIGVYVRDPDTLDEVLYSYSNSGQQSDFLPAAGGATVVEQVFDLTTVVGNVENITAVIDDYITIATKAEVEEIRPYVLPEAGEVGQLLRKATNAEGDTEWFDPAEGINVRVHSITERRVAVADQRVFNLADTRTAGLAVYVDGMRLAPNEWQALNTTQVQLDAPLAAGTVVQFVNNEEVGENQLARVSLIGPNLVYPASSNTYTITDFDTFSTYAVESTVGTVTRTDDTITLDVPLEAEEGSLTLTVTRNAGSASVVIAVGAQTVATPEMLNPANGAIDVGETSALTTSAFVTYPSGSDTHASTDWQLSTASDFSTILWESLADTANLESIQVPSGILATSTAYYARARHNGSTIGTSEWSAVVSFTTAESFYISNEMAKFSPWELDTYDRFGRGASIDGQGAIVVIGAPDYDRNPEASSGVAFVYEKSGSMWSSQKIAPSAILDYGGFGGVVAISGDGSTIAVPSKSESGGDAVYIFNKVDGVWTETAILKASYAQSSYNSVALNQDGSVLLVGSAYIGTDDIGEAYVFEYNGAWNELQKLVGSDSGIDDRFGASVSLNSSGSRAAITSNYNDTNGAVYIFEKENGLFVEKVKLTSTSGNRIGYSSAISEDGNHVITGDAYSNFVTSFVYSSGAWEEKMLPTPSDIYSGDSFGYSVSLSGTGDIAAIGAPDDDVSGAGSEAGSVYLFAYSGSSWEEVKKLNASDASGSSNMGYRVSLSHDAKTLLATAPHENTEEGSAYIFQ